VIPVPPGFLVSRVDSSDRSRTCQAGHGPQAGGLGPATVVTPYTPLGYSGLVATTGRNAMYGYTMNKKAVSDRLRRIEGQVRGIQRMVEEDQYCIDILTQVNSAASALKSVGMGVLDDHVRHCVKESIETGESDEKLEELLTAVARFAGK
jgi:DNA-binding FrmR family transcriptional regulator